MLFISSAFNIEIYEDTILRGRPTIRPTVTQVTPKIPSYWRIFGRKDPIFSREPFQMYVVPVAQRMSQQTANNL